LFEDEQPGGLLPFGIDFQSGEYILRQKKAGDLIARVPRRVAG
jgi:hypothetical protein